MKGIAVSPGPCGRDAVNGPLIALWVCALALGGGAAAAQTFQVNSPQSDVRLFAYNGGLVGHNHVVVSADIAGTVRIRQPLASSTAQISIPLDSLIVDDPEHRRQEGGEFAAELSAGDREKIKKEMLGDDLLHATKFPLAEVALTGIGGTAQDAQLALRVTIHGTAKEVVVPARLRVDGERFEAAGQFAFKQSDFGIKPLSKMFGVIKVKDEVMVKFTLVADRGGRPQGR